VEGEDPLVEPAGVDDEERSEFLGEETPEYGGEYSLDDVGWNVHLE
jgi:hypothetical protein